MAMTIDEWNRMPAAEATGTILACCGSQRWAQQMVAQRPFSTRDAMQSAAQTIWQSLAEADWLEAFNHHPRIGQLKTAQKSENISAKWAKDEQNGSKSADENTLKALAAGNAEYESKFHHVFLVCATGKTANEMLGLLRERITNAPDVELRNAMIEQSKITRLRIEKLFES